MQFSLFIKKGFAREFYLLSQTNQNKRRVNISLLQLMEKTLFYLIFERNLSKWKLGNFSRGTSTDGELDKTCSTFSRIYFQNGRYEEIAKGNSV